MTCSICNASEGRLEELLRSLTDPALLVTLACDFAERVCGETPDTEQSRAWLASARAWQDQPESAAQATDEAGETSNTAVSAANSAWAATCAVSSATWIAVEAVKARADESEDIPPHIAAELARIPNWVAAAKGYSPEERTWQLRHVQELACTCLTLVASDPSSPRFRPSTLATN